jgi:hypothetical protein
MVVRSPARWNAQRLTRHPAKCFARANRIVASVANRVANFVTSGVATRRYHLVANPVLTVLLTRVNRLLIVWLAARRQGSFVLLPFDFHLDDARFARTQWRLRIRAGSVTVVDEKTKGSHDERADAAAQALVTALGCFLASSWH